MVSSCEARDLGEPVGRIGYQGAVEFYVYCTCDPDVTALGESLKAFGKVMITSKGLIRYYDPESELFSKVPFFVVSF